MRAYILGSDVTSVRRIRQLALWEKYGFREVISLYSREKTGKVFQTETVDFVVCDLTKYPEDWLALLRMVQENCPNAEFLLTGKQMEEKYFRQILRLGVFDFLEQPVSEEDMELALETFTRRLELRKKKELYIQSGKYWEENHALVQEMFWKNLCLNRLPEGIERIEEEAARADAGLDMDARYTMVLLALKNQDEMWNRWGEDFCQTMIRNLARTLVKKHEKEAQAMVIWSRVAVLLEENELDTVQEKLSLLIEACKEELDAAVFCYVSEPVYCEQLPDTYAELLAYSHDDVLRQRQIVWVKKKALPGSGRLEIPAAWSELLYGENPPALVKEVRSFLTAAARKGQLTAETLQFFQQDVLQLFFSYMGRKGVSAHELYDNPDIFKLYRASTSSIDDMCLWVETSTEYITRGIAEKNQKYSASLTAAVKEYALHHLQEPLTISQIAEDVHLSADYMTRLFRQETGMTIKEYLIQTRMEEARRLLQDSPETVSTIAAQVGYDNLSYFVRQFRSRFGITPKQYQKQNRK